MVDAVIVGAFVVVLVVSCCCCLRQHLDALLLLIGDGIFCGIMSCQKLLLVLQVPTFGFLNVHKQFQDEEM